MLRHLYTKTHLCLFRFVSSLVHPKTLKASLEESRLKTMRPARFCKRCRFWLEVADSSPHTVSVSRIAVLLHERFFSIENVLLHICPCVCLVGDKTNTRFLQEESKVNHGWKVSTAMKYSMLPYFPDTPISRHFDITILYFFVKTKQIRTIRSEDFSTSLLSFVLFAAELDGMLVHRRSLPRNLLGFPNNNSPGTHLYTWVERGTVRVKYLAQECNRIFPARAQIRTARSIRSRVH